MSISTVAATLLAAAPLTPATSPAITPTAPPGIDANLGVIIFLGLLAWTFIAVILAIRLHVFRPDDVVGPKRLPDEGGTRFLLFALIVALCVWLFGQGAYLGVKQAQWKAQGIAIPKDVTELLSPVDFAVISTVPPMLGFLAMLGAGLFVGNRWLDRLGLGLRKLGPGILKGILGFIIVGPVIFWTLVLLGKVYQIIHFEHPTEHVLLKRLGEAQNPAAAIFIAIGAAICAPLFEEFLFRGHLQTLIRQLAMLLFAPRVPVSPEEMPPATDAPLNPGTAPLAPSDPTPLAYQRLVPMTRFILQPAPWHGWLAIFLTSLIFAMFHPLWMWPPIFVLSIGLGYTYERTGNLWAAMTIHCLFNSVETIQYLMLMRGH